MEVKKLKYVYIICVYYIICVCYILEYLAVRIVSLEDLKWFFFYPSFLLQGMGHGFFSSLISNPVRLLRWNFFQRYLTAKIYYLFFQKSPSWMFGWVLHVLLRWCILHNLKTVFLIQFLNFLAIFCFILYIRHRFTTIYGVVFGTRPDVWNGAFCENSERLKVVSCFCRNLRLGW